MNSLLIEQFSSSDLFYDIPKMRHTHKHKSTSSTLCQTLKTYHSHWANDRNFLTELFTYHEVYAYTETSVDMHTRHTHTHTHTKVKWREIEKIHVRKSIYAWKDPGTQWQAQSITRTSRVRARKAVKHLHNPQCISVVSSHKMKIKSHSSCATNAMNKNHACMHNLGQTIHKRGTF